MERYRPHQMTDESLPVPITEPFTDLPPIGDPLPDYIKERIEFALTKGQRKAILDRDDHQSQMRHYDESQGWYNNVNCPFDGRPCSSLQVHHIKPQRTGGQDDPNNLITLTECEHNGHCKDGRVKKR